MFYSCFTASGESSPVSMRSSSTLPIPQPSSAPSTPTRAPGGPQEQEEERGDLIRFYNHVYIKQIKPFALRYSSNSPKNGVIIVCIATVSRLKTIQHFLKMLYSFILSSWMSLFILLF